jgi:hypothetical protein
MRNYILVIVMVFLCSCHRDIQGLTIEGIVYEAENKEPIPGVDVTVVCWTYNNSPDESYSASETRVVQTDTKGKYSVSFDKGAFVEVYVVLNEHLKGNESVEVYDKRETVDVIVKKKN